MKPTKSSLPTAWCADHNSSRWGFPLRAQLPRPTAMLALFCIFGTPLAQAVDRTWTGAVSSDWFTGSNWSPPGVPGTNDNAIVNSGNVVIASNVVVGGLTLNEGSIGGAGDIAITGTSSWSGGMMDGSGVTTIVPGGMMAIEGSASKTLHRPLNNSGTIIWAGSGSVGTGGGACIISNLVGGVFEAQGSGRLEDFNPFDVAKPQFYNTGFLRKSGVGTTNGFSSSSFFFNDGQVEV